jgi:thioredoxin 1
MRLKKWRENNFKNKMSPLILNDENFGEKVLKSKKPVLVDFWTTWCTPCKFLSPILDKVLKDFEGKIEFAKVDIDEAPLTADTYDVAQIPTIMLFNDGKPVSGFVGVQEEEAIKEWLQQNLPRENKK